MGARRRIEVRTFWLVISLLAFFPSPLAINPLSHASANPEGDYTYYGIVPPRMWQYNLTDPDDPNSGWLLDTASVSTTSMLAIVAAKDKTQVRVYTQDNSTLVSEALLDSMEKHYVVLPNGTVFKVETSELACVLLLNYGSGGPPVGSESEAPIPNTFYQSTSGAYIGKEFVLIGSGRFSQDYIIIALENAEVTTTRDDGEQRTYTLEVNTHKELMLKPFSTYKFESTGNIMIQSGRPTNGWDDTRIFTVPAAEGGHVGQTFYTWSSPGWDLTESYGFRVSSIQDAKVTVWNLQTKEAMMTLDVTGGSGIGFKAPAPAIVVQSNQPVTLSYIHNGTLPHSLYSGWDRGTNDAYGSGVAYIGVKPDQDTPIYFPTDSYGEAYIFANEDTQITIDGYSQTIEADSYYLYSQPGTHTIRSDKKVVVQLLFWPFNPEIQGLQYNGVQIPCTQTVDAVPEVTLTPLGEAFPITYVIAGAAVAAVAVAAVLLVRRRHS